LAGFVAASEDAALWDTETLSIMGTVRVTGW
jgi:hypothetical protein